jgi:hypothetical protein
MALNTAGIQLGAAAIAAGITFIQLHTAAPDATGNTNVTTAGRKACTLTATGGNISLSAQVAFTGGAANGPVTHVSYWSASTGGTYYGSQALTGDQTFNSAGEYTVTALTINGSAS